MPDEPKIPQPGEEGYATPKPGDQKFSRFFDSYLELVSYVHDGHYFFKVLENPKWPPEKMWRNQTPWSELLWVRPDEHQRIR